MTIIKYIPVEGTSYVMPHCARCGRRTLNISGIDTCSYCELTVMCECGMKLESEPHQCFYSCWEMLKGMIRRRQ